MNPNALPKRFEFGFLRTMDRGGRLSFDRRPLRFSPVLGRISDVPGLFRIDADGLPAALLRRAKAGEDRTEPIFHPPVQVFVDLTDGV